MRLPLLVWIGFTALAGLTLTGVLVAGTTPTPPFSALAERAGTIARTSEQHAYRGSDELSVWLEGDPLPYRYTSRQASYDAVKAAAQPGQIARLLVEPGDRSRAIWQVTVGSALTVPYALVAASQDLTRWAYGIWGPYMLLYLPLLFRTWLAARSTKRARPFGEVWLDTLARPRWRLVLGTATLACLAIEASVAWWAAKLGASDTSVFALVCAAFGTFLLGLYAFRQPWRHKEAVLGRMGLG